MVRLFIFQVAGSRRESTAPISRPARCAPADFLWRPFTGYRGVSPPAMIPDGEISAVRAGPCAGGKTCADVGWVCDRGSPPFPACATAQKYRPGPPLKLVRVVLFTDHGAVHVGVTNHGSVHTPGRQCYKRSGFPPFATEETHAAAAEP